MPDLDLFQRALGLEDPWEVGRWTRSRVHRDDAVLRRDQRPVRRGMVLRAQVVLIDGCRPPSSIALSKWPLYR
jgi:hypothetical protein